MCESYVQAYSNPYCSASFISSIVRWYGGSGRTVTPKLSIDHPRSLAGERAYRRENGRHSGGRTSCSRSPPAPRGHGPRRSRPGAGPNLLSVWRGYTFDRLRRELVERLHRELEVFFLRVLELRV